MKKYYIFFKHRTLWDNDINIYRYKYIFLCLCRFWWRRYSDIAIANPCANQICVKRGKGTGYFYSSIVAANINAHNLPSADFNGDGKPDMAATIDYQDSITFLLINSISTAIHDIESARLLNISIEPDPSTGIFNITLSEHI